MSIQHRCSGLQVTGCCPCNVLQTCSQHCCSFTTGNARRATLHVARLQRNVAALQAPNPQQEAPRATRTQTTYSCGAVQRCSPYLAAAPWSAPGRPSLVSASARGGASPAAAGAASSLFLPLFCYCRSCTLGIVAVACGSASFCCCCHNHRSVCCALPACPMEVVTCGCC